MPLRERPLLAGNRRVCMASRKQEDIEHITERCLIAQKKFIFKQRVDRQFSAPVREFFFLISVKRTISMKILVLRVVNSSRHRNYILRGYIRSLFVSKALTRSYLARSGFHTNNL